MKRIGLSLLLAAALAAGVFLVTVPADAQPAAKGKNVKAKAKAAAPQGGGGGAYPQRPSAAPEILARGKALFDKDCGFCHGEDARGGEMGNNLLRSQIILNDDDGEKLAPVLRGEVVPGALMPKFTYTPEQVSDVAAYLHSFRVNGYDGSRDRPGTILVGDPQAGLTYFTQRCASCHSVTGDMAGIGGRIGDPRTLQQRWLNPAGGGRGATTKPTTVTVTANGQKTQGELVRIDDFLVTLKLPNGRQRTFTRDGDTPRVEVSDPYQPHKDLWPAYTDKDIHNVTAYLATLK